MPQGYKVSPLSRKQIREFARLVRQGSGIKGPRFSIVRYLEHVLPTFIEDFYLEVCNKAEMGLKHGQTYPSKNHIQVREDVYNRACDGEGRDRLTLAHELGHLFMHQEVYAPLTRGTEILKPYEDSEWQADCFGGELLISSDHIHLCSSPIEATVIFGVSLDAANYQWRVYEKEGII